jgi:hypothetical protein
MALALASPVIAVPVHPVDTDQVLGAYIPQWQSVTTDVCRDPETGVERCTFRWALTEAVARGVIPDSVRQAFLEQLEENPGGELVQPAEVQICPGEANLAMSFWRDDRPIFFTEMEIVLPECTDALRWTHYDTATGVMYQLFRVLECGNVALRVVAPQQSLVLNLLPEWPLRTAIRPSQAIGSDVGTSWACCADGGGGGTVDSSGEIVIIDPTMPPATPGGGDTVVDVAPVPLPPSVLLLVGGIGSLLLMARRHRRLV